MRADLEVTEFVIMSGPEVHDYLVAIRAQLRSYLVAAFPMYRFSLMSRDGEGMGFVVVPIIGELDACDPPVAEPGPGLLREIADVLERFQPLSTVH